MVLYHETCNLIQLTYSIPNPMPFSNQSPTLSPMKGHQENSLGNIGEIRSGLSFFGHCGLLMKLTMMPTTTHIIQGMAENHMYEISYIFKWSNL